MVRSGVGEADLFADELGAAQPHEGARVAQLDQVQRHRLGQREVLGASLLGRVLKQRAHDVPLLAVLVLGRQADTEVVLDSAPVDRVEVIAGVVGIAVQRLGAHEVRSGVEERRRLRERNRRELHGVHSHAIRHRRVLGQLDDREVEQCLVIVRIDVGDDLIGLRGIACWIAAVVKVLAGLDAAVGGQELVVREVTGKPEADEVALVQEIGSRLVIALQAAGAVRVGVQPGAKALIAVGVPIDGAATVHGVAQAIGERRDAGVLQLALDRLGEARVAADFAEVPAFAVQVDGATVDPVLVQGEGGERLLHGEHVVHRVVAHEVEAEARDVVVARPRHDGVNHELLGHLVFGGDVLAARGGLDLAGCVQAVVVARHDLIEHGLLGLTGGGGVVKDLIGDDTHPQAIDRGDHLAVFRDAARGRLVERVGALGREEVEGIVTPVKAVLIGDRGDGGLLFLACWSRIGDLRGDLGAARFRNRRDIEGWQQVQRVHARSGELL